MYLDEVCRTLRKMVKKEGWRAFTNDEALRLRSPTGKCEHCPEKAVLIFAGGPRNMPWRDYTDIREIARALGQHPAAAISVALASDNVKAIICDGTHIYYRNRRRRRDLFLACGLECFE